MNMIKKFKITQYDQSIKEAPFKTIYLDEVYINKPDGDDKYG